MQEAPSATRLDGRTIAVPESRELDQFASMLERRGAAVVRCPLVDIRDAPDPRPVLAWLERFCAGGMEDLILLTGEGLRRLLGCIEQHRPELREAFVAQLARVRKLARGPKPGRALRELGLKPELVAEEPTTAGVIATLAELELAGRRVGVQLYGTEPNRALMEFLERAGARADPVAPYIYADDADEQAVLRLIARLEDGALDAIAFTSLQQVERLFRVARENGRLDALRAGLERCCVAAVGPVVADNLRAHSVRVDLMPRESFFLKPLISALAQRLGPKR